MKRNIIALAVAALLAGTVATNALAAGHGGGNIGGRFGEPLTGSAPMTSPIYNPSTPYTVPQCHPRSASLRQVPDHCFTKV